MADNNYNAPMLKEDALKDKVILNSNGKIAK